MRLTVERLGHRGDAVAEGIHVVRALPGEVIEGAPEAGRIAAPEIVRPAPERVAPPCPHYDHCGGCALQHASDDFIAQWKAEVVATALAAQGLEAPMYRSAPSPANSRRRATLAGRRLKKGVLVGFHGRGSDTLTEIRHCHLLHPELIAALPALEAITAAGASRKGELALMVTQSDAGVDVAVRGGKPLDGALRAELGAIAGARGLARLSWDGEIVAQHAAPEQTFGAARVTPPPGAFLQPTRDGEAALQEAVARAVGAARRIVDLFAGCGTFTLPLAAHAEIHAVEGDGAMLDALDTGWRHALGLKRVTTETRDLARNPLAATELSRFRAAVIDPPRAGADAQTAELAAARLPVIAAVSCNPATFARDARVLTAAGYRLDWVQLVDQFRWSPHVELAARLSIDHTATQ